MKILVCDKMDSAAVDQMKAIPNAEVMVKVGMKPEELNAIIPDYHIVIVRSATKIKKDAIDVAKNLKVIIRGGVGLDNIDVDYAKSKNIIIRNTPKASSISVAELALGMMFCLVRNLVTADKTMKEGKWEKKLFEGIELYGKTLAIIGCGNIGTALGNRALALGMKVKYTDILFRGHEEALQYAMKVACKVSNASFCGTELNIVGFDEAISKADIISLHIPYDEKSGPVIKEAEFEKMKKGVIIINAARGGVVKESALLAALKSGKVAAAAIDVFEKEPSDNMELIKMPNVICSPHIGASTHEGQNRVGMEVVEVVKEYNF